MKTSVLFLLALSALCMTIPASAQHRIGIVGGLNLTTFDRELTPSEKLSTYTGIGLGGILGLGLANNVVLRFMPMYLQKGAKDRSVLSEARLKLSYLEVPALVKIAFGTSTAKPYIMVGPTLGFLLSAKATVEGESVDLYYKEIFMDWQAVAHRPRYFAAMGESVDVKELFKDIDFGLNFGAGVSFPAGNNAIFVEGRYGLGLSNIAKLEEGEEGSIKTRGIQFMAGVTFPLGGQ
jgi:hypothetical protein